MIFQFVPLSLLLVLSSVISLGITLYAWKHELTPYATPFAFFFLSMCIWALAQFFHINAVSLESKRIFLFIEFAAINAMPITWFVFVYFFLYYHKKYGENILWLFLPISLAWILFIYTNPMHHLFWNSFDVASSNGFQFLNNKTGIGFWLFSAYVYVVLISSWVLLLRKMPERNENGKTQIALLVSAQVVSCVVNVFFILGFSPVENLDLTAVTFTIGSILIAVALFRYRMLSILPFAKDAIFNSMADQILVTDGNGGGIYANDGFCSLVGQHQENIPELNIHSLFKDWAGFLTKLSSKTRFFYEKDKHFFAVWKRPIYGKRKKQVGMLILLRDVSSEDESEYLSSENEGKYKTILDGINLGVSLLDENLQPVVSNKRMREWFPELQVKKGSLITEYLYCNITGKKSDNEAVTDKKNHKYHSVIINKVIDEKERIFAVSLTPFFNEQNKMTAAIEFVEDITEIKRAEEQLKRYQFMVNASLDFMSIINRDYRYEAVNDAFCIVHNRSRQDIVGRKVSEIWDEEVFKKYIKPNIDSCLMGERSVVQSKFRFGLQGVRYQEISYNPYTNSEGYITHVVVVTRDITGYKEAEEALRRARREAEDANQAKSNFLASMSHEIRTPMNAIIGMTDLTMRTELSKQQQKNLETIKISAKNLLAIINDILDLSKIEAGRIELENTPFHVKEMIQNVIKTVEFQAKEKEIDLGHQIGARVPTSVKGDSFRLTQILINLLTNAIKFTYPGGKVSLTVTASEGVREENEGKSKNTRKLHFAVSDNGIGIGKEKQERIFDSFSQADSSTTRRYGGTGLGLSICKQLVNLMDGHISVDSEQGKGSTFSFSVQVEDSEPVASDSTEEIKISRKDFNIGKELNILVAEDNEINAQVAQMQLNELGVQCSIAENGKHVINILQQRDYDLILMDIEMPEMDGLEATKRIRSGEAGEKNKDIPIIAMTAHGEKSEVNKCYEVGMNEYIGKPVELETIYSVLKNYSQRMSSQKSRGRDDANRSGYSASERETASEKSKYTVKLETKEALARLNGDRGFLSYLYNLFLSQIPEKRQELEQAHETKNMKQLADTAHSISSTSRSIGAEELSSRSKTLEKSVRRAVDSNPESVPSDIDDFQTLFDEVLIQLNAVEEILTEKVNNM